MGRAALVFAALMVFAILALRGFNRASRRNVSDYPTCPDLSELSYGDLPSWPSVRVG